GAVPAVPALRPAGNGPAAARDARPLRGRPRSGHADGPVRGARGPAPPGPVRHPRGDADGDARAPPLARPRDVPVRRLVTSCNLAESVRRMSRTFVVEIESPLDRDEVRRLILTKLSIPLGAVEYRIESHDEQAITYTRTYRPYWL